MTRTRAIRLVWALAATGAIVVMLVLAPRQGAAAYLAAYVLLSSVPLGAAGLLMMMHASGGTFADPVRPTLERAAALTPWLVPLAVPIAVTAGRLYPWADVGEHAPPVHPYFHPLWVALRTVVVLTVWAVGGPWIAGRFRALPHGERAGPCFRAACCAGLVVFVLADTVGFTDAVQSLRTDWHSSILGCVVICSQALVALGMIAVASGRAPGLSADRRTSMMIDIGNLLLAFVILHAYMHFSQFLIIWSGNVPARTSWFRLRTGEWAEFVAFAMLLLQFVVPFVAMLFRRLKSSPRAFASVAVIVFIGAVLEAAWMTIPSISGDTTLAWALYPVAAIALAALVLAATRPAAGNRHPFASIEPAR